MRHAPRTFNAGLPIGPTIRKIRNLRGMSQRLEAVQLGMSYVHLCKLERSHSEPSPTTVARIRDTWGIDVYVMAWLAYEFASEATLMRSESTGIARKLLGRGLDREFTYAEVESFLKDN